MRPFKYLCNLAVVTAMITTLSTPLIVVAQTGKSVKKSKEIGFPDLINTDIKGAPKLGKPILLTSGKNPLIAEGMGWAAPAVWDWDGDGKKDLLIGEFSSGVEHGRHVGNFIRVYKNIGTVDNPEFENDFHYANIADPDRIIYKDGKRQYTYQTDLINYGTPISVPQFCCMAIKPQFADLNGDGIPDLYSGTFTTGDVYWFEGNPNQGFQQGRKLKQQGQPGAPKQSKNKVNDPSDTNYWNYSAVSFGDFRGNGLLDMIVGGHAGLRISKNTGTKTEPEFGLRELLLTPDGSPVFDGKEPYNHLLIPIVVDWDQDGVLDVLTSCAYVRKGDPAVLFFKGVKINNEYRLEKGIPLLKSIGDVKAFPGEWQSIYVTDWNNDGFNDLLIGTKVAYLNNEFNDAINWAWNSATGRYDSISKLNPGYFNDSRKKDIEKKIALAEKLETELGKAEMNKRRADFTGIDNYYKYATKEDLLLQYYGGKTENKSLVHKGYVYLMLGEKR